MQKSILSFFGILLFVLLSLPLHAQNLSVQKVKAADITYVLNNIRSTHKTETANFIVNVYAVANKSGSAKQSGSDEVTDHLYIAISSFDENPQQLLFVIKDVYGPSAIKMTKQSEQVIELSFFYREKGVQKKFIASVQQDGVVKK